MITVKIECRCGQHYTFEVEPVNGRMPNPIFCPVCTADGTLAANEQIAKVLGVKPSGDSDNPLVPKVPEGGQPHLSLNRSQPPGTPKTEASVVSAAAQRYSNIAAASAPKKPKTGFWAGPLFIIALLAVGGGGYYWWQAYRRSQAPPPVAVKTVTNAEPVLPKTLQELNQSYQPPTNGQNAAVIFEQAFNALQVSNEDRNSYSLPLIGKGQMPPPDKPINSSAKAAIADFLNRNQAAMTLIEKGAGNTNSHYQTDLAHEADDPPPHILKLRPATQLAALTAMKQADDDKGEAASRDVVAAFYLAQSVANEPTLISQMVRAACLDDARQALEQTLNRVALPANVVNKLGETLEQMVSQDTNGWDFTRGIAGYRIWGDSVFNTPPEKLQEMLPKIYTEATSLKEMPEAVWKKATNNLAAQRQFFDNAVNQVLDLYKKPFPERLQADTYLTNQLSIARTNGFALCSLILPPLGLAASRGAMALVDLNTARIAVELEQFRTSHDNYYPGTLAEMNESSTNPFNGEPFGYQKKGDGYQLYTDKGAIVFKVVTPPLAVTPTTAANNP